MPVSIITPTTGRMKLLERCIKSVTAQDVNSDIEHLIIGDNLNGKNYEKVNELCSKWGAVYFNYITPVTLYETTYQPVRTGRVRNYGITQSKGKFIGHLDDDNTFEINHVSTLLNVLKNNKSVDIAYSWRKTFKENGEVLIISKYPWIIPHRDQLAKEVYEILSKEGFFKPGVNIIFDNIPTSHGDLYHIDSSEWIMRRNVFEKVKFREFATPREMIYQFSEDYMFCKEAFELGFVFEGSGEATLNYYFSGYSSANFDMWRDAVK